MCEKFLMDYHNKMKLIDSFEKTTFYDLAKQKFKICQWAPGGGHWGAPVRNIMNVVKKKCIKSMSTMFTEMCRNYPRPHHF